MSWDLIVVGGGIVGASVAYHSVRAGVRTLLVDARDEGRATDAGAGIVSAATNARDPDAWQALARAAVEDYPRLAAELRDAQPGDPGYDKVGMLVVATDEREAKLFDRYVLLLRARGDTGERAREIDPSEARERFPPLGRVERALFAPGGARVDGRKIEAALLAAADAHGLERLRGRVERLIGDRGAMTAVEVDGERLAARGVAICGGAWSASLATRLGVDLAVTPQRGQIVHLELAGRDTSEWALVGGFRDHYMVPWPGGRVAVGATREDGTGFDPRATAAGVREVLDQALAVAPGLAEATIREIRVGLRPRTPDLLPLLGALPGYRNVWLATGHGPTGLTLGPFSGKLIASLARGEALDLDLGAFRPDRPGLA
jgi:D-amino-acid dehydrogenase